MIYKRTLVLIALGLSIAQLSLFTLPRTVLATVPAVISYQGRLSDSSGNLVGGSGTTYYFKFSLWTSPTVGGGSRVWPTSAPTSFTSTVRNGVFNINIGDTANGYPDTLDYAFTNPSIYLQVEVSTNGSSFETLSPRQPLTSTPFSQVAGRVSGTGDSTLGNATSTNLFSTTASSTNLFFTGANGGNIFSSGLGTFANLLSLGSTTLQNFTGSNSTTTNATSTSLRPTLLTHSLAHRLSLLLLPALSQATPAQLHFSKQLETLTE